MQYIRMRTYYVESVLVSLNSIQFRHPIQSVKLELEESLANMNDSFNDLMVCMLGFDTQFLLIESLHNFLCCSYQIRVHRVQEVIMAP